MNTYSHAAIDAALSYLIRRLPEIDRYLPAADSSALPGVPDADHTMWGIEVSWSIEDLRTDAFADTISLLPVMGARLKFAEDFDPAEYPQYAKVRRLGLQRSHPKVTWQDGQPRVSMTYYQFIPKAWFSPADLTLVENHK